MTRRKSARGKSGPKPGFMPVVNLRRAAARAAAKAAEASIDESLRDPELVALTARVRKDPLCRTKELRTMEGAVLRAYARGLFVPEHNVVGLSDDRLRQNCLHSVASITEALTE